MISCHFTQLADKGVIAFIASGVGVAGNQGKDTFVSVISSGRSFTPGFLDKAALGGNECLEVFKIAVCEQALRHGNADGTRLVLGIGVALVNIEASS